MLDGKSVMHSLPSAAGNQPRLSSLESHCLQKFVESFLATELLVFRILSLRASFNINIGAHQRSPPICPSIHNCPSPSRYSPSHFFNSSLFCRFILVCLSCFSQTTTISGVLVMASTKMSEWVVTI